MTVRTITVTLPKKTSIWKLEAQAHTTARSVDDLVAQGLTGLSANARAGFAALGASRAAGNGTSLRRRTWAIARSVANEDKLALYDLLIERQDDGSLTAEGRRVLTQLREDADALMVRKAHAYALLQSRGYTLPKLDELHIQAP